MAKVKKESEKKELEKNGIKKRRYVRFKPEPNVLAQIDLDYENKNFNPTITGLVFSESYGGCGVVILLSRYLQVGEHCRIKVGEMAPIRGEVAWRTQLDDQVMKLGLKLLE